MPRTIRSICTPARLASYSASIMSASPIELHLSVIRPSAPNGASCSISVEQPRPQVAGRDEQRVVLVAAAVAGEVVEQLGDVGTDVGVAREDPEVLVQPGRLGVVVAGADVAVAAQLVAVVAHDEHALGVGLQPDHAVHDVDAGALELLGPADVGGLVEAGLAARRARRPARRARRPGSGERMIGLSPPARYSVILIALHPRVLGGLLDERLGAAGEALVRVVHEDRPVAHHRERAAGRPPRRRRCARRSPAATGGP